MKFHLLTTQDKTQDVWVFHCPGCKYGHSIRTKGAEPCWQWNGNPDKPTATPSLLIFPKDPERRCHLFIKDGQLEFLPDCHHELAGKTVDIPDFNS